MNSRWRDDDCGPAEIGRQMLQSEPSRNDMQRDLPLRDRRDVLLHSDAGAWEHASATGIEILSDVYYVSAMASCGGRH